MCRTVLPNQMQWQVRLWNLSSHVMPGCSTNKMHKKSRCNKSFRNSESSLIIQHPSTYDWHYMSTKCYLSNLPNLPNPTIYNIINNSFTNYIYNNICNNIYNNIYSNIYNANYNN